IESKEIQNEEIQGQEVRKARRRRVLAQNEEEQAGQTRGAEEGRQEQRQARQKGGAEKEKAGDGGRRLSGVAQIPEGRSQFRETPQWRNPANGPGSRRGDGRTTRGRASCRRGRSPKPFQGAW